MTRDGRKRRFILWHKRTLQHNSCEPKNEAPFQLKQGRIHGKTVVDDWAGAIMQSSLRIKKKNNGPTY